MLTRRVNYTYENDHNYYYDRDRVFYYCLKYGTKTDKRTLNL